MNESTLHIDTRLTHLGRPAESDGPGVVNTPVYHASTITFPSIAAQEAARKLRFDGMSYGRNGTPEYGCVIARTPDGERLMARVPPGDTATIAVLTDLDSHPVGRSGTVSRLDPKRLGWAA